MFRYCCGEGGWEDFAYVPALWGFSLNTPPKERSTTDTKKKHQQNAKDWISRTRKPSRRMEVIFMHGARGICPLFLGERQCIIFSHHFFGGGGGGLGASDWVLGTFGLERGGAKAQHGQIEGVSYLVEFLYFSHHLPLFFSFFFSFQIYGRLWVGFVDIR